MSRNINSGNITKNYILSKVSQISIFSAYLNITDSLIQYCIDTGELMISPIREDIHPTVGFKYDNRGRLKMKDFAGYFWGDCFDLVALVISSVYKREFNVSNKKDFIIILRHITIRFKNVFYGQEKDITLDKEIEYSLETLRKRKPNIELVVREWNIHDRLYWDKLGVPLQYLNTHFIYAVEQYYIDRKFNPQPKYFYRVDDPCYGYLLGQDRESNIYNMKLYFPEREHGITRFITNCNHLEGIYNLERNDYDIIIITKSTKDRLCIGANIMAMMSLYRETANINIGIINIPHETYRLRTMEYDWLKSKLKEDKGILCSLMDNDRVGKLEANYLRNSFDIIPLMIDKKYNAKDFAELRANNDIKIVYELIINSIKYVLNYGTESNKLIRNKKKSNISPF